MCILLTRDPIELKFEVFEMQKWNIPTKRSQSIWDKLGPLSIYHAYSYSYDHLNVKNDSFFVFSARDSKKLVTAWAKYFSATERFYWVLSENDMVLTFVR